MINDATQIAVERRHPIVVILGHIDHGKTTLLNRIRQENIAEKESGGITQHIGAYQIEGAGKEKEGKITFLDTPGHEAFRKMRSRGARVADIALLVVSADEGVKPQTEEALAAIREAEIPFIVVLSKIDRETADPERVKKELAEREVYLEEWGGKTPLVMVSAKTGQGIEELLEVILLVAGLENLAANLANLASGVVIESYLDPKRGNGATLLLREGTLKKGDFVLAGSASVKVRILEDSRGKALAEASASSPVKVIGFDRVPVVGSVFKTFASREEQEREHSSGEEVRESSLSPTAEGVRIAVIMKADTMGSLEALEFELRKFESENIHFTLLRREVGPVREDDLKLAASTQAPLVVGFRVGVEKGVTELARRLDLTLKTFELIYEFGDWIREETEKRLPEEKIRKVLGRAEVLKIFKREGPRQIVGGVVKEGGIFENKKFSLLRRDFPLAEGKILELEQGKIKVREVLKGTLYGALVDCEIEIAPHDAFEIFEEEVRKRKEAA